MSARVEWHDLSNVTCLIRPRLFYASLVCHVKDRTKLPHYSPLLKKTCVRREVLEEIYIYIYTSNCIMCTFSTNDNADYDELP